MPMGCSNKNQEAWMKTDEGESAKQIQFFDISFTSSSLKNSGTSNCDSVPLKH